jgi:hypothetical protein
MEDIDSSEELDFENRKKKPLGPPLIVPSRFGIQFNRVDAIMPGLSRDESEIMGISYG